MINVKILAKNWGDKSGQMTTQEFRDMMTDLQQKGRWAIFALDTAVPAEERVAKQVSIEQVKDGMEVSVVPQLAGG